MKRWKLLSECEEGDWVFCNVGKLYQVVRNTYSKDFDLSDGIFIIGTKNDSCKVYPLNLYNKRIADSIYYFYDEMHKKHLINGSKWVNWLSEKMDELMDLPEDSDSSKFHDIYNSIRSKIEELEYHKSFL